MSNNISTHILDTALGKPASNVSVTLERNEGSAWKSLGQGVSNSDGRVPGLFPTDQKLVVGIYRLNFDLKKYFSDQKRSSFFPQATLVFEITDANSHYHVPLLTSGFGYSTYRGS